MNFCNNVRYLGVYIDQHIDWNCHTSFLSSKLRKANGALSKLRHFVPKSLLKTVYYALFSSHMNYGAQLWGYSTNCDRIYKLQKTAIRIITFSDFFSPSKPLFCDLRILPLPDLIKYLNVKLIFDTLNLISPADICHTIKPTYQKSVHLTRISNLNLLLKPSVKTSIYGIKSIRYQSCNDWNSLQLHFKYYNLAEISVYKLNRLCKTFLFNNPG